MENRLVKYLKPMLSELYEKMDRRSIKTLLESEASQAGIKRISNLLTFGAI